MNIKLSSDLQYDSIVDGEGIRTVIWTQGCPHRCKGCHNPETHDFDGGKAVKVREIKKQLLTNYTSQDGITLSGGEPFCQPEACTEIAIYAKKLKLNVWCYTGYTFEQILAIGEEDPKYKKLLDNIDVLVDGKFEIKKKTFDWQFRGSKNQRIIDVKKSSINNQPYIIDKYDYIDNSSNFNFKEEGIFV